MATKEAVNPAVRVSNGVKEKEVKSSKEGVVEVNKEKLKALQLTIDKLEKAYGKGTIMKMGVDEVIEKVDAIPTG